MRLEKVLPLALAVTCCGAPLAHARAVKLLSYQELVAKSDLVVIATPTARTNDTIEQYTPDIRAQDASGELIELKWIGVETPFAVAAAIKGDANIKAFTLHHYREPRRISSGGTANGPHLVSFDPGDGAKPFYLLFLVREPDGRYAPTDGQTDPGMKTISKVPFDVGAR
jgi:hypothetical protein